MLYTARAVLRMRAVFVYMNTVLLVVFVRLRQIARNARGTVRSGSSCNEVTHNRINLKTRALCKIYCTIAVSDFVGYLSPTNPT